MYNSITSNLEMTPDACTVHSNCVRDKCIIRHEFVSQLCRCIFHEWNRDFVDFCTFLYFLFNGFGFDDYHLPNTKHLTCILDPSTTNFHRCHWKLVFFFNSRESKEMNPFDCTFSYYFHIFLLKAIQIIWSIAVIGLFDLCSCLIVSECFKIAFFVCNNMFDVGYKHHLHTNDVVRLSCLPNKLPSRLSKWKWIHCSRCIKYIWDKRNTTQFLLINILDEIIWNGCVQTAWK